LRCPYLRRVSKTLQEYRPWLTGQGVAFTDSGVAFADLQVRGPGEGRSLAMVTEEQILEATMAVRKSEKQAGSSWVMWTFWAAGVTLVLVELNAGMGYVEAGLGQSLANLWGWLPTVGMATLRVAEQSIWNWGTVESVLRGIPLGALGFLLVALGLALMRRPAIRQEQSTKH
jgi:hypothetical protein